MPFGVLVTMLVTILAVTGEVLVLAELCTTGPAPVVLTVLEFSSVAISTNHVLNLRQGTSLVLNHRLAIKHHMNKVGNVLNSTLDAVHGVIKHATSRGEWISWESSCSLKHHGCILTSNRTIMGQSRPLRRSYIEQGVEVFARTTANEASAAVTHEA
jgi:hypothetical protein